MSTNLVSLSSQRVSHQPKSTQKSPESPDTYLAEVYLVFASVGEDVPNPMDLIWGVYRVGRVDTLSEVKG